MAQELSVVGKSFPLKDGYEKVTGAIEYAVDVSLPGMMHAKVLRSPYAHARIVRIDTTRAEALPGVGAVITHLNVPEEEWEEFCALSYRGRVLDDRVRFVGDEVAAVAARDKYIAEQALRLIEVEYEELPHVFDIEEAIKPEAPQVTSSTNVRDTVVDWGDIERGFAEADFVIEQRTNMGNQQSAPLGRNACVAKWKGEQLTIWTSTHMPSQLRDIVATFLKLPRSDVRVIGMPSGPSFGLWWVCNFHLITALLAKKAGKPVKLDLTQEEAFATVKRRETPVSSVKLGVKKDGSFTAIHFTHHFDNGAYGDKINPYESVSDLWGRTPHGRFEMYGISTNLLTAGCMRGVGDLTMNFCMEQAIDRAAEKVHLDPLEIRIRNRIEVGSPVRNIMWSYKGFGQPFPFRALSSCGLDECITEGAEAIGWSEKWKGWGIPSQVDGSKRRGLGMATSTHISGDSFLGTPSVVVKVNHDGSVTLLTGVARLGQGADTTQAQIAAEELGVPLEKVGGIHGDTDACPWGVPSVASINSHVTGLATKAAAADAKRQILKIASEMLEAAPEDMDIKDSVVFVRDLPSRSVPLGEVMARRDPGNLAAETVIGRGSMQPPVNSIAKTFMAHFVELEVDTETGLVTVLRYVAAHDCGKVINPIICENQVSSGAFLGSGFGLVESLVFDQKTGRILNPNYVDYKILSVSDFPDPEMIFVDVIDPVGPYGAKGFGEAVCCPAPTAVAQAIHNAIGIRFDYAPITPEMILSALKAKSSGEA